MHYYRSKALSWFGQAVQAVPSRSTYISVFRDNVFFDYLTGNCNDFKGHQEISCAAHENGDTERGEA